jgi:hypothetical protein
MFLTFSTNLDGKGKSLQMEVGGFLYGSLYAVCCEYNSMGGRLNHKLEEKKYHKKQQEMFQMFQNQFLW